MSYEGLFDGTRKAAKAHRCALCGSTIPSGTVYARRTYKFDGDFCDETLHTWCRAELEWLFESGVDEFNWEEVHDFVDEELREYGREVRYAE